MRGVKKPSAAAQNQIEAAPAPMAPVSAPDCCDPGRMPRGGEPVVDRRADAPARDGRFTRPMMAGNQQDDAVASVDRLFQRPIDCTPGAIEILAVKVDDPIRLERAAAELPVPACVKRRSRAGWRRRRPPDLWRNDLHRLGSVDGLRRLFGNRWNENVPRKRPDRRSDPAPELLFLRAERAHAMPRPWAAGSTPARTRTFRRPAPLLRRQHPRTCRTGSAP